LEQSVVTITLCFHRFFKTIDAS